MDLDALEDLITRFGQLADDLPEVAFMELNPIIAHPRGSRPLAATGRVARRWHALTLSPDGYCDVDELTPVVASGRMSEWLIPLQ